MTKEAAIRSVRRRVALTKAAGEVGDMLNSYLATQPKGILRAGAEGSVNDLIRKSRPPATAGAAAAPAAPVARPKPAAPSQAYSGPPFWAPAATAVARGVGRAVELGASWPDHVKAWWNKTTRR